MKKNFIIFCVAAVLSIAAVGAGCADRSPDAEESAESGADNQAEPVAGNQVEPAVDNQTESVADNQVEPAADNQAKAENVGEAELGVADEYVLAEMDKADEAYVDGYVATPGGIDLNTKQAIISSNLYHNEFYEKMPEVRSAIRYLSRDSEPVTFYYDNDELIAYGLYVAEDKGYARTNAYVKQMESEGYKVSIRDATRSSTFELENGKYVIKIHMISDLPEFITDKAVAFADNLKDINIVVEVAPR
jgi:hypothetical protein